jgi:hypothetical protein
MYLSPGTKFDFQGMLTLCKHILNQIKEDEERKL